MMENLTSPCDELHQVFEKPPLAHIISLYICIVVNLITCIGAIFGNTLIILVILRTKLLQSNSNYILLWLCITDALVGFLVQPITLAYQISALRGTYFCDTFKAMFTIGYTFDGLSIITVGLISCERALAVFFPYEYIHWVNKTRISITIGIIWVFWIVYSALSYDCLWKPGGRCVYKIICLVTGLTTLGSSLIIYAKIFGISKRHLVKIAAQEKVSHSVAPQSCKQAWGSMREEQETKNKRPKLFMRDNCVLRLARKQFSKETPISQVRQQISTNENFTICQLESQHPSNDAEIIKTVSDDGEAIITEIEPFKDCARMENYGALELVRNKLKQDEDKKYTEAVTDQSFSDSTEKESNVCTKDRNKKELENVDYEKKVKNFTSVESKKEMEQHRREDKQERRQKNQVSNYDEKNDKQCAVPKKVQNNLKDSSEKTAKKGASFSQSLKPSLIKEKNNVDNRSQRRDDVKMARENRVTRTMMFIVATLIICYTPVVLVLMLELCMNFDYEVYTLLYFWASLCAYSNSFINPYFYCFRQKDMRTAVCRALKLRRASRDDMDSMYCTASRMN